jgi:hypothetical protein
MRLPNRLWGNRSVELLAFLTALVIASPLPAAAAAPTASRADAARAPIEAATRLARWQHARLRWRMPAARPT